MLPLITKVLLLIGLLILLVANTADWVKVGVSKNVKDTNPNSKNVQANVLAEVDAGLWTHCASLSGDILPSKGKGILGASIGGCGPLTQDHHGHLKDYMITCQVLSVVCLVSVFLALICSLINRDDDSHSRALHICTAIFSLIALSCSIAVLIIYSTKIKNQEIGTGGAVYKQDIQQAGKGAKSFRGLSAGFYLQIVGTSLVSLAGLFSLIHYQKSSSSRGRM